jgi:hypothetical protein
LTKVIKNITVYLLRLRKGETKMKKEMIVKMLENKKGHVGPDEYVGSPSYIRKIAKEMNIKISFWGSILFIH